MASHGDGKNNKRMAVLLPKELHRTIKELAELSDLTVPHYIERVLGIAAAQRAYFPPVSTKLEFPQKTSPISYEALHAELQRFPDEAVAESAPNINARDVPDPERGSAKAAARELAEGDKRKTPRAPKRAAQQ